MASYLPATDVEDRPVAVLELGRRKLVRLQDRDHTIHPRSPLQLESSDMFAVADCADHRDLFAPAGMGARPDALHSVDDGLHLLFGGRRFHHDHHLLVLSKCWKRYGSSLPRVRGEWFSGARPLSRLARVTAGTDVRPSA